MAARYGTYFRGDMDAAAVQKYLEAFDLRAEVIALCQTIVLDFGPHKACAIKRLKIINALAATGNPSASTVLARIPVIPPDPCLMVQLGGGYFATSDLNGLYRRVINRNTRPKHLFELGTSEIIVNNEKRMSQESVDVLFDNGRRGRPVVGPGNRPLKSTSDMSKGKQGRLHQNPLSRCIDYSGRPVIVIGPQLQLYQCGLPRQMVLELSKSFVMKHLVGKNYA